MVFDVADVTHLGLAGRCSLIDHASCLASPLRNDDAAIRYRKEVMVRQYCGSSAVAEWYI